MFRLTFVAVFMGIYGGHVWLKYNFVEDGADIYHIYSNLIRTLFTVSEG